MHHQVRASGIEVDEKIVPLLLEVWSRGLATQFSCQGIWAGPEYKIGNGTKDGPGGLQTWWPGEDERKRAYILFRDLDDAVKFLYTTTRLLLDAAGPDDCVLYDAELKLESADPEDGSRTRGCIRFHPAILGTITRLWKLAPEELNSSSGAPFRECVCQR
ncbi:hypothetical protein [Mycobacterium kyorinense]|nr:hypothetical protein [Mycobacterium kyorinense]